MTLTKHHIEVTMPSIHETGEEELYKLRNWKEACEFIELFKPEWANCREVEEQK